MYWQLLGHLLQVAKAIAKTEQLQEGYRVGETFLRGSLFCFSEATGISGLIV